MKVPKGGEKVPEGNERIFEEIMAKDSANFMKTINLPSQDAQRGPDLDIT